MLSFDRESLTCRLDRLSQRSRTVFALACSERLLPIYEAFGAKSPTARWIYLRAKADDLWDQLTEGVVRPDDKFLAKYPSLAPGDATPRSQRTLLDPLAENTVLALGSAWESHVSGESKVACWAAEQAYEAMDYMAQHLEGIDYGKPDGEDALLKSNLVQDELRRQLDNLTILEQIGEGDTKYNSLVKRLREQAWIDGQALKAAAAQL